MNLYLQLLFFCIGLYVCSCGRSMLFLLLWSGIGIGSGECYSFYSVLFDRIFCTVIWILTFKKKSPENGFGTLIGSSFGLQTVLQKWPFSHTDSSDPWAWEVFPPSSAFFSCFFHVFIVEVSHDLVRFIIPRCYVLFSEAIVNGINSLFLFQYLCYWYVLEGYWFCMLISYTAILLKLSVLWVFCWILQGLLDKI